jgi:hypothetical protein
MISGMSYDWADTSDQDSLPSLCSDSDPEDMDQQVADDLELSLVYGKIEDDDPIQQDDTEVGNTDDEELKEALLALVDKAMVKGASIEFLTELRELLVTYKNAFRLRLQSGSACQGSTSRHLAEACCV